MRRPLRARTPNSRRKRCTSSALNRARAPGPMPRSGIRAPAIEPCPPAEPPFSSITSRSGPLTGAPRLTWHGITDTGMLRPHNEDNLAHMEISGNALFVVADGMGGHDAGEVASGIAVETVGSEIKKSSGRASDPLGLVDQSIQAANAAVHREASRKGSNMGTTLAVARVIDGTAYVGNVGDSRVYWIENGSITQLTEDHSLVAKLVAAGKLTREEARIDPRANLLFRTIGIDGRVKVAVSQRKLA